MNFHTVIPSIKSIFRKISIIKDFSAKVFIIYFFDNPNPYSRRIVSMLFSSTILCQILTPLDQDLIQIVVVIRHREKVCRGNSTCLESNQKSAHPLGFHVTP